MILHIHRLYILYHLLIFLLLIHLYHTISYIFYHILRAKIVTIGRTKNKKDKAQNYLRLILYISLLFYIITLPVEFNASNRALKILKESNTLDKEELKGTKKVLKAAALTYVASALSAIFSLLRLIFISKSRKSRN